jgi:hypothetical protein
MVGVPELEYFKVRSGATFPLAGGRSSGIEYRNLPVK